VTVLQANQFRGGWRALRYPSSDPAPPTSTSGIRQVFDNWNGIIFVPPEASPLRRGSHQTMTLRISGGRSGGQELKVCLHVSGNWDNSCQFRELPRALNSGENIFVLNLNDFGVSSEQSVAGVHIQATDGETRQSVTFLGIQFSPCARGSNLDGSTGSRLHIGVMVGLLAMLVAFVAVW
jgi:hypothetical protein